MFTVLSSGAYTFKLIFPNGYISVLQAESKTRSKSCQKSISLWCISIGIGKSMRQSLSFQNNNFELVHLTLSVFLQMILSKLS